MQPVIVYVYVYVGNSARSLKYLIVSEDTAEKTVHNSAIIIEINNNHDNVNLNLH